jgi:hypothetical protein
VSVVCCQVEVSATSWSLVQRSRTERGVSISVIVKRRKMTSPRPPKCCRAVGKKNPDNDRIIGVKERATVGLKLSGLPRDYCGFYENGKIVFDF